MENTQNIRKEIELLKEEQANFDPETDHWFVLEEKIKKLTEQLNKAQ